MTIGVALAGPGAFGTKHLDALAGIDAGRVVSIVGGSLDQAREVARAYGVGHATVELAEALCRDDVDAVILATPTPRHAEQAVACLDAGKHVQVEIPLCDDLAGARRVVAAQRRTGLVAMCGHTRRFNPGHQWVHRRVESGAFTVRHLNVQTYFLRRTNINARGEARGWTDHLLWHHAAHTVDLFTHQTRSPIVAASAMQGPIDPDLGIALDLSIQLRTASGALCTLALSFNHDGPFGSWFRYIGDTGTYIARYDELVDGWGEPIDAAGVAAPTNGVELQDREFLAAIGERREPESSVVQVLPCYEVLDRLERQLSGGGR